MLIEVHLIQSDGEMLNCMLLCTKKHVTSAVPTQYLISAGKELWWDQANILQQFVSKNREQLLVVLKIVKYPHIVERKYVPRVQINALSDYSIN
jgi:hypothetical protein